MTFSQISRVLLIHKNITTHRQGLARFLKLVNITGSMNRTENPKRKKLITEEIYDFIDMVLSRIY